MSNKKYLYQKSSGEWIFGPTKNSICPAGIYRLVVETNGSLTIRHIYNRDITYQYAQSHSDFLKENNTTYVSLNELLAATLDFFSGVLKMSIQESDIQIGAVELKDGETNTRAKITTGSSMSTGDNALAVADPNLKSSIDTLKNNQFPENMHVLSDTNPAPNANYKGFYALAEDTAISSISGIDTEKVTGNNNFSGLTFQPGIFIPIAFTSLTLSAGAMILVKA